MEKYLVFRLEKKVGPYMVIQDGELGERCVVQDCFELVKEFDEFAMMNSATHPEDWARQYSLDNKVRTLVIKGSVFG